MKIKILLFLLSFIVNMYCQDHYKKWNNANLIIYETYAIKCLKENCKYEFINKDKHELALSLLKHIYSVHSFGVDKEFKQYITENSKLTENFFYIHCRECKENFFAPTIPMLANIFKIHTLMTKKHNSTGFHNMLEYVYEKTEMNKK